MCLYSSQKEASAARNFGKKSFNFVTLVSLGSRATGSRTRNRGGWRTWPQYLQPAQLASCREVEIFLRSVSTCISLPYLVGTTVCLAPAAINLVATCVFEEFCCKTRLRCAQRVLDTWQIFFGYSLGDLFCVQTPQFPRNKFFYLVFYLVFF